jgi:mono/diheme cytochrome c family protein
VLKQACAFTAPTDGPGLYDAYCSGCHGNAKKGASASAIQAAINGDRGGMRVLSALTPAQVALIAAAP